jgi:hypothetical protein
MMALWNPNASREMDQSFRVFISEQPGYKLAQVVDVMVEACIRHWNFTG